MLAAIRCEKGDLDGNLAAHLRVLAEAAAAGCDLVLFPEMSLTGSVDPAVHPGRLVAAGHRAVAALVRATGDRDIAACFGIAARTAAGLPMIAQIVAAGGAVAGIQFKRYLGEGEEAYAAGSESVLFTHAGVGFAVAICAEAGYDSPFDSAAAAGVPLVLFPAAPGLYGRRDTDESWRRGLSWWESAGLADARRHAGRLGIWIALAGQAGSTADEDFPGLAALVAPDGSVAARLPDWRAGLLVVDLPLPSGRDQLPGVTSRP